MATVSHADEVTLAWDANTDPAVTGYKLYYGTASGVYPSCIDVGNVTQYTVGGLLSGETYFFAVRACSGGDNQSGYSAEISYTLPLADSDGDGVDDSEDVFPSNPAEWADHDYDGTGDNADIDDDNDGVADAVDAYPYNASEWVDTDGDNVGNNADTDDDNDSVNDGQDRFPLDSSEWADLDDDGIGDNADADDDADGIDDEQDAFPADPLEWIDTDRDTIGNNADPDDDNDGMPDEWEIANQLDPLVDDAGDDEDGDGISNADEYSTGGNPLLHEANQVPDSALLLSPVGGDIVTATPQLEVDSFSDPDFGDTHARTQWQIIQAIDDHCVFDVTSDTAVTALAVPRLILEEDTEYYWRARYYDNHGAPSEWSQFELFSTEYLGNDGDGNGVPDDQEVGPSVDLDKDGVNDFEQDDIRCVELAGGKTQLGVSARNSAGTADVISLTYEDPSAIGAGVGGSNQPLEIPFGLINFKVRVDQPGDEAVITVYFSKPAPKDTVWYKYDPVEGTWVDYSAYSSMSANRKAIQMTLVDGGDGDADGTANGVIVDPAGLVIPPASNSVSDIADSAGDTMGVGGCFIGAASPRNRPVVQSGQSDWLRPVRGREAAVTFTIVMLVLAGRLAFARLATVIRERMQMAVGARLRS